MMRMVKITKLMVMIRAIIIREHHYFNFHIVNNFVDCHQLEMMIILVIAATANASAASDGDDGNFI